MMCFNKKVIGGLAIVALGILVVAPNLFLGALPLLLVAACPLSMLLMGRAMMGGGQRTAQNQQAVRVGVTESYTCPMHPSVTATGPGRCSECGMELVQAVPAEPSPAEVEVAQLRAQLERVTEQQAALARLLGQLEGAEIATTPSLVVVEAEQIAQAATRRLPQTAERS